MPEVLSAPRVMTGDKTVTDGAVLGKLRRVIARGRDYLPDSGRFRR
jgi:hypothetical protein